MSGTLTHYPWGCTLSGATRSNVITTRAWQPTLVRRKCPFCENPPEEGEYSPGPGWRLLFNKFTPHKYHRLLIPTECWPDDKLRDLGGEDSFRQAITYALAEIPKHRPAFFPTRIVSYIGHNAGQNLAHHHWHLLEPDVQPEKLVIDVEAARERGEILCESEHFVTLAYGVRAGEMVVEPRPGKRLLATHLLIDPALVKEVVQEVHHLVARYNEKFNWPDYSVNFVLHAPDDWRVHYIPFLNNWGGTEYLAIYYGTQFVLAWPHAETVRFLQS